MQFIRRSVQPPMSPLFLLNKLHLTYKVPFLRPFKNKYVLVVGDYLWTEAYPLPNQEAKTVARVFVEEWVYRYGTL